MIILIDSNLQLSIFFLILRRILIQPASQNRFSRILSETIYLQIITKKMKEKFQFLYGAVKKFMVKKLLTLS